MAIRPQRGYWELEAGGVEPELFFRALPEHFPDATTLFIEGTANASEVLALLGEHAEAGEFLPGANTIWPESKKLRCRFSAPLAKALAEASRTLSVPEVCDHVFLYRGDDYLLYWHDAFDGSAGLAPDLSSDHVDAFARALGCAAVRSELESE